jgi:hypothetical protein
VASQLATVMTLRENRSPEPLSSAANNNQGDALPEGGEEPPQFTPYEAEHWESRGGEIISHDPHLNEDGS